jgi:hypothetical protein
MKCVELSPLSLICCKLEYCVYKCINHALKLHCRTKMYFSQCVMYGVDLFYYASTGDSAVELLVTFMRTYDHGVLLRIQTN